MIQTINVSKNSFLEKINKIDPTNQNKTTRGLKFPESEMNGETFQQTTKTS